MSTRPNDRATIASLIRRFDRPGPRYTSYPTAVEFTDDVGESAAETLYAEADALHGEPLSLYVHLPFCEHRCLFCGCHVVITPHRERVEPYLDLVAREAELVAQRLPHRRSVAQLHLGGGTPTYHEPASLDRFLGALLSVFTPTPDAELAIEVDPRVTQPAHLEVLAKHGFNRISLGVQDFTPAVQHAIERVQSEEETKAVLDEARRLGFRGVNVDLIYGLPHQSPETFERTVERVIEFGADRAAVYSFAYVPWIRAHMKAMDPATFPSADEKVELFALARERFLAAGFDPIGMDHFARTDDELAKARREGRLRRNFQGYTVIPAPDVVALGISGIGDVRGSFLQNTKKLSHYRRRLQEGRLATARGVLAQGDDALRRTVIHDLMCNFRVDRAAIEARFGIDFDATFRDELARLEPAVEEGLVVVDDEGVRATPAGELFVRNVAMCFDRYYWETHAQSAKPVFSRTV